MTSTTPSTQVSRLAIPRIGLGCMGLSEFYGATDDETAFTALKNAFELGYRHFDTADMYGRGLNERLLGRFLAHLGDQHRSDITVATKAGIVRDPEHKYRFTVRGDRAYIRDACHQSLGRLGVDYIDLFYIHRLSPSCSLEETLGAAAELYQEGKIRSVGLCEVDAVTLRRAHDIFPLAALQSEFSLWSRDVEKAVLPATRSLGVQFVAFSPLGRGFLTGSIGKGEVQEWDAASDLRTQLPRFQKEYIDSNLALVMKLKELAASCGTSPARLALAWVLSRSGNITVIPGSRRHEHLRENLAAAGDAISDDIVAELGSLFSPLAVSGARYPAAPAR